MTFGSVALSGIGSVSGIAAAGAWFFPFLIASLAYYHHTANDPEKKPINQRRLYQEYDFIVVGQSKWGTAL